MYNRAIRCALNSGVAVEQFFGDAISHYLTAAFLLGVLNVIFIDLLLAGDNALIIALAVRHLEGKRKNLAIWCGTLGAVILRLLFLAIATFFLGVPFLHAAGGAYIIFIAVKLLKDEEGGEKNIAAKDRFWSAVWTIIIADVVMSIDNVLAVAAVASGNFPLLVGGILLSVPIMIFASSILSRLMQRFPVIILIGSCILAWVGGKMFVEDPVFGTFFHGWSIAIKGGAVAITLAYYGWRRFRRAR